MENVFVKWFLTIMAALFVIGALVITLTMPHAELALICGVIGLIIACGAFCFWEEEHLAHEHARGAW